MGIKIEFNPELCLRNISEFKQGKKVIEECIPENLEADKVYDFLKNEQRNFWLLGEIPLTETKGNGVISRPLASVIILEATHFMKDDDIWTRGKYKITEIFNDDKIHFESTDKIGSRYEVKNETAT